MKQNPTRRMLAILVCLCMLLSCLAFAESECTHPEESLSTEYWHQDCEFVYIDETSHQMTGDYVEATYCDLCESYISEEIIMEDDVEIEAHYFENGVCYACEYTNTCTHPEDSITIDWWYNDCEYEIINETTHKMTGKRVEQSMCGICNEYIGGETYTDVTEIESHYFENGSCYDCGYVNTCEHEDKYVETITYPDWDNISIEPIEGDNAMHMISGTFITEDHCNACGETVSEPTYSEKTEYATHYYVNGVCEECGYTNTCEHTSTDVYYYYEDYNAVDNGDGTHTVTASSYNEMTYCTDCETDLSSSVIDTDISEIEKHFYYSGICDCGAKNTCEHPEDKIVTDGTYRYDETFTYIDENTHKTTYSEAVNMCCSVCGENLYDEITADNVTEVEDHIFYVFNNGKCECGYVNPCEHPESAIETDSWAINSTVVEITETTCTHRGEIYTSDFCTECGSQLTLELVSMDDTITYDHHFYEGACIYCGYEQSTVEPEETPAPEETPEPEETPKPAPSDEPLVPEVTPTAAPEVTPTAAPEVTPTAAPEVTPTAAPEVTPTAAPEVTPTAEPEETPKPAPSDEPIVNPDDEEDEDDKEDEVQPTEAPVVEPTEAPVFVEAEPETVLSGVKAEDSLPMVETIFTIVESVAAESETAVIEIVNLDKIVTEEEAATLKTLPMQEQLLVVLSAIGFDEAITTSLEGTEFVLSEEAIALKELINARLAEMDETAKAEFDAMMLENFPTEVIEIEGVEYTYFVLELEITVGDEIRYEGYGFRFDETTNAWLLTKLYTAN